jgi:uncharacterized protein
MRKIIGKQLRSIAMICILLSALLFPAGPVLAETSGEIQHVYDKAELLSTSELSTIEDMCIKYSEDANVAIIILTHNDSNAVEAEQYIEDFYDENMNQSDSVILLVDMANRKVCIEGYGTAMTHINSYRGDVIRENITPYLTDGDYVTAFEKFIKGSDQFMKQEPESNSSTANNSTSNSSNNNSYSGDNDYSGDSYNNYNEYSSDSNDVASTAENILTNLWFQLAAACLIGAIAVGIMAVNAGGRMTVNGSNYIDPNHSGLIGRRDDYIRTQITRAPKPKPQQNDNNFGGGAGGISSGGSSHSTSSGSF